MCTYEEKHRAVDPSSGISILSKQILKRGIIGFRKEKKNAMLSRTRKVVYTTHDRKENGSKVDGYITKFFSSTRRANIFDPK